MAYNYLEGLEDEIVSAMMDAGTGGIEKNRSPRLAFYTTPEKATKAGYVQTDADRKMNYKDMITGTEYAWVTDKDATLENYKNPKTLGEYLDHSWLYKIYPQLKDKKVIPRQSYDYMKAGRVVNSEYVNGEFQIGSWLEPSIVLHEVQHAIQEEEGWFQDSNDTQYQQARVERGTDIMESVDYRNSGMERQARIVDDAFSQGVPAEGVVYGMEQDNIRDTGNPFEVGTKEFEDVENQLTAEAVSDLTYSLLEDQGIERVPDTKGISDYNLGLATDPNSFGMTDEVVLNTYEGGPEAYMDDEVAEWDIPNQEKKKDKYLKGLYQNDSKPQRVLHLMQYQEPQQELHIIDR